MSSPDVLNGTDPPADESAESPASAAKAAANQLFDDPDIDLDYEPSDEMQARAAVEQFGRRFVEAPGALKKMMKGARAGAETLSTDRLQGLAELIQNADDTGARTVAFQLVDDVLVAGHDGSRVLLADVLAMATPWVSGKADDARSTGRFGIGLMTLRTLSDMLEVHSHPYHLRLGAPDVEAIELQAFPDRFTNPALTVFRIPVGPGDLALSEITDWFARWDDSALLFLRYVERIELLGADGSIIRTLELGWREEHKTWCTVGGERLAVRCRTARAPDGRAWLVRSVEAPTPSEAPRTGKPTDATIPLEVALPLQTEERGVIHAGLPVIRTFAPVRVNAQFDPVTNRQGFAPTRWNHTMLPLLADLWTAAVEQLFEVTPDLAWNVVPLTEDDGATDGDESSIARELESLLLDRARSSLSTSVNVPVADGMLPLVELAVEELLLERLLTGQEVAELAGLPKSLPTAARDSAGRWRAVLDDWRLAGAALAPAVTVEQALVLLEDERRSPSATLALMAAGVRAGLDARLARLPCIVTDRGDRLVPPERDALNPLVLSASPLADALGVGIGLDQTYLADTDDAETVLRWLRTRGSVIDGTDDAVVVRRIAAAGRSGHRFPSPLTDDQAEALRRVFEEMDAQARSDLGHDVGSAISLSAFAYDSRGRRVRTTARPVDAYLPRAIDREPDSFAAAADTTPGLLWIDGRYAEFLRSTLGRSAGLGPQRFLRMLGAEIAPRCVPHAALEDRYPTDSRMGLPLYVEGGPTQRNQALSRLGASYTLQDFDSPDLMTVIGNIARERGATRRRRRASALIGVLGRAWDRLADYTEVVAANDYYSWQEKGPTRSFWLWAVGAAPWLDDTDGVPRPPLELRLRTPGTVAVHGTDAGGYLRPEFDSANRREVLAALGVSGEPSTRDLVDKLRAIRQRPTEDGIGVESSYAYQALAERLTGSTSVSGDLTVREIRAAFAEGAGLVRTQQGWRRPNQVFDGPPVFRDLRAFVPQVPGAARLWRDLQIRPPSLEDCIAVVGEIARTRRAPTTSDVTVLLETMRLLVDRLASSTGPPPTRLRKLALWTTRGWTTDRPVYAVDDATLTEGLGQEVPVWLPGGELSQFVSLLAPLRVTELASHHAAVIEPEAAYPDAAATELLGRAVPLLSEDLARNEPATAGALHIGWQTLSEFEVRINPDLRVTVTGLVGDKAVQVAVPATVDSEGKVLYLRNAGVLRDVDGGGQAIAGLFSADRRQVAQAWLAACVNAEKGRIADGIRLAAQRAEEEGALRAAQLRVMSEEIASNQSGRVRLGVSGAPPASGRTTPTQRSVPTPPPPRVRFLVDPASLVVVNPDGRPLPSVPIGRARSNQERDGSSTVPLHEPDLHRPPRQPSAPSYTVGDPEDVGIELLRHVLANDDRRIVDVRVQAGVGADAVDDRGRFYELKVYRDSEPDMIRLQKSEIERAVTAPEFYLVVVSGIEGPDARPRLRIIADPIGQLEMLDSSSVTFAGVRSAELSLVYDLAPPSDAVDLAASSPPVG